MAGHKTRPTDTDPQTLIAAVEPVRRREQAKRLLPCFEDWTELPATVWGDGLAGKGIIGFGRYHYRYESGREGEYFLTGFSPRKSNMVVYVMPGFSKFERELQRLGPHRKSVSCLYLTDLQKIDVMVLRRIVINALQHMQARYEWWPR